MIHDKSATKDMLHMKNIQLCLVLLISDINKIELRQTLYH